jgi:hypothetical protein
LEHAEFFLSWEELEAAILDAKLEFDSVRPKVDVSIHGALVPIFYRNFHFG